MSKIDADAGPSKPGSLSGGGIRDNAGAADTGKPRASGSGSTENRSNSMEQAAERIQNVKLETSPFGEKVRHGKAKAAGPSLLSQQAPGDAGSSSAAATDTPPTPSKPPPYSEGGAAPNGGGPNDPSVSTSAMSVDQNMPFLEGMDKITVKIADLGNGEFFGVLLVLSFFVHLSTFWDEEMVSTVRPSGHTTVHICCETHVRSRT